MGKSLIETHLYLVEAGGPVGGEGEEVRGVRRDLEGRHSALALWRRKKRED